MSSIIATENQNTGSTGWDIRSTIGTTQIQAYSDKVSLDPGQTINFFVSTQSGGTGYRVDIYRLGWYGGTGGCLKNSITGRTGIAQGYWDNAGNTLHNCPTMIFDNTTHLLEAGWSITDSWTVPSNACTGIYAAVFTDANGKATYVTFTVRGNPNADYVVVRPDTTDTAYNNWGGYSLYTNPTVDVKSSFNKPQGFAPRVQNQLGGSWGVFAFELPSIHWLESQGYDMAYISNVDIQTTAGILLTHKAYISLGHDEYWTLEMRNAVEAAQTAGLGLAFLGANDCYWQMRFENDNAGNSDRTVTCYKCITFNHNLNIDPFYGVDNTRLSTQWRDSFIGRPENGLCGVMFKDLDQVNTSWAVDANAGSNPLLAGTGLVPGQSYGTDLVGYEWDKIPSKLQTGTESNTPNNIQIIGTSPLTDTSSQSDVSHTTTHVGNGGALVFASGSISWTWALDSYRWAGNASGVIPEMQRLMANIMTALISRGKNPTGFSAFSAHR
jgi:hypothetical protein